MYIQILNSPLCVYHRLKQQQQRQQRRPLLHHWPTSQHACELRHNGVDNSKWTGRHTIRPPPLDRKWPTPMVSGTVCCCNEPAEKFDYLSCVISQQQQQQQQQWVQCQCRASDNNGFSALEAFFFSTFWRFYLSLIRNSSILCNRLLCYHLERNTIIRLDLIKILLGCRYRLPDDTLRNTCDDNDNGRNKHTQYIHNKHHI